jgi:hypothetical protein
VVVQVDGLPSSVKRGHTARIIRILAHRENVIVIPKDLVRTYLSRDFVRVLVNGQITEKTVEVGVQTFTEAEIVSGLAEGDQILSQ